MVSKWRAKVEGEGKRVGYKKSSGEHVASKREVRGKKSGV